MYFFFCHRAVLPHLIPDSTPFKPPGSARVISSVRTSWIFPGAETRIFFFSFLQPLRILHCVLLSLNLPTDLESGLLEGVNYHTAYAQLVSITPGLWLWDESDLSSHKTYVPTRVFAYPSTWLSTKPWDQIGLSLLSFPRWGIQALWECVPCRQAPTAERINERQSSYDFWSSALPLFNSPCRLSC